MQEKIRPGYKQTEVGVLPEDWRVISIRRVVDRVRLGGNYPNVNALASRPLIKMGNMGRGFIVPDPVEYIPDYVKVDGEHRLRPGDVIFNTRNTLDLVGKVCVWRGELENAYYNSNILRLEFDAAVISSPYFVNYQLNSEDSVRRLREIATGTTSVAAIYTRDFLEFLLPIPPRVEQRAIAEALSDADARIAALEALIAKKRDLKQAAMQQLLTGKTRLPGFSGDWEAKRLGDLGSTYGGLTGKSKVDFGHGSAKYIPFMNVMTNVVVDLNSLEKVDVSPGESQNQARAGDLFFNGSSETPEEVGMCALLAENVEDLYLNSFCFGFRLKPDAAANGLFLAGYFRSQQGRDLLASLAQGATRYNLSKRALLKVEFACPSLDEQIAIAEILSDMDAEIAALDAEAEKARTIKQGMMQNLLTGKVRLV